MHKKQLESNSARSNLTSPKPLQDLASTLASLRLTPYTQEGAKLLQTNYIKSAVRKGSVRPTTADRSISRSQRSNSIEAAKDSLYTGTIDEYSLGQTLGFGAYAIVKLAVHLPTRGQFAIKTYEKAKLLDPQRKKNVISEIKILKTLSHPNIIKLKEAINAPRQVHIVMEYIGACSLWSFIKKRPNRQLPEPLARRFFSQILLGINYCHNVSVIHRDIKLENILLDSNNNVKIIDFGFATLTTPSLKIKLFCGTPSYMAPEIVGKRENPGAPADVWALGVLLFTMLSGTFPFKANADRELYRLILKGNFEFPQVVSQGARGLIKKMLQIDPRKRPTCAQILTDPWVGEFKARDCVFTDSNYLGKPAQVFTVKAIPDQVKRSDKENQPY